MALAAATAACDKTSQYRTALEAVALYHSVGDAVRSPGCTRLIKAQHAVTLPIPLLQQGKGAFVVGFYSAEAGALEFAAAFPPGRGQDAMCTFITAKKGESIGPLTTARRDEAAHMQHQAEYFKLVEAVAPAFFAGRAATEPEKRAAKDLLAAFQQTAEPGLLPSYYRLSPDFWEYLRKEAGASIPKA